MLNLEIFTAATDSVAWLRTGLESALVSNLYRYRVNASLDCSVHVRRVSISCKFYHGSKQCRHKTSTDLKLTTSVM